MISVMRPSTLEALQCRLRYHWAVVLQLEPVRVNVNFGFGTAIHKALEYHYLTSKNPVGFFQRWMDKRRATLTWISPDLRELGSVMLRNYIKRYRRAENFELIAAECEIKRRVPIPFDELHPTKESRRFYVGTRIDAIVRDNTVGQIFAFEHKTFARFYPQSLPQNQQFVIERYVAEGFLKRPVAGVIYNGLRKRVAPTPKTRLFERHYLYISDEQVETMLHRVYWELKLLNSPYWRVYPEPSAIKCTMCQFRQPCTEYMRGGDYWFLLDNLYQKRGEDNDAD